MESTFLESEQNIIYSTKWIAAFTHLDKKVIRIPNGVYKTNSTF